MLFEAVMGVIPVPAGLHRFVATNALARSILLRPYAHRPQHIAPEMIANLLHGFGATGNRAVDRVVVLRDTGHNAEIERPNTLNRVLLTLLDDAQSRQTVAPPAV